MISLFKKIKKKNIFMTSVVHACSPSTREGSKAEGSFEPESSIKVKLGNVGWSCIKKQTSSCLIPLLSESCHRDWPCRPSVVQDYRFFLLQSLFTPIWKARSLSTCFHNTAKMAVCLCSPCWAAPAMVLLHTKLWCPLLIWLTHLPMSNSGCSMNFLKLAERFPVIFKDVTD